MNFLHQRKSIRPGVQPNIGKHQIAIAGLLEHRMIRGNEGHVKIRIDQVESNLIWLFRQLIGDIRIAVVNKIAIASGVDAAEQLQLG